MIRGIAVAAVLAIVCAVLTATPAVAGEKTHTITICTPDDETKEFKVKVDVEERGWLGVSIQDLDEKLRKKLGMADDVEGVLVTQVHEGSPAETAGLVDKDVIVIVGGEAVTDVSKLSELIAEKEPGSEVGLTVLRDGKEKKVYAVLGSRPIKITTFNDDMMEGLIGLKSLEGLTIPTIPWIDIGISSASGRGRLGVYPDDLTEGLAEYFGVPGGEGALVEDVVDDSPAEKAGLKAGDVIIKIGEDKVSNVASLVEAIGNMEADVETPIIVFRKGKEISLKATVGESEYDKAIKQYKDAIKIRASEIKEVEAKALEKELEQLRKELEELRKDLEELDE